MLSIIILNDHAEFCYVECYNEERHYTVRCFSEHCNVECRYAECRSANARLTTSIHCLEV